MIVITAPTGNIGHQVLDHVLAADRPVRVVARDPAKLPARVRERVEIVPGSHRDPAVVERAFAGADAVFWLVPADPRAASLEEAYVGFSRPAAAALRQHGVRRVVDISALGRGTPYADRAGYVTGSLAMDDLLAVTGVALRTLTAAGFLDNVLRQVGPITGQGTLYDILPPRRALPMVATRDIAAVAARLLLDDDWTGRQDVPLLGPENLSSDDLAATIADVLGRPVRYEQVTPASLKEQLLGFGRSEAMAQGLIDMMIAKADGLDDAVARTERHLADTPTTFRRWCEDTLVPAVRAAA
jgi:uncharacterized protein YbjT (DUF2867 family)